MTTPQTQPTPEQWADTLEKLARDKALPSLWPEDCLAIAAHLRAQAAPLASKEAECERLRAALGHIESLERRARKRVNELHAEGMGYTTTYEEAVEKAQILERPAGIARKALTPTPEAPK